MRNDAITFTFSNNDGREIILEPQFVHDVAHQLNGVIERAAAFFEEYGDLKIGLIAADRGSLRLSFVAFWSKVADKQLEFKDAVALTSQTTTVATVIIAGVTWVGIQVGVFTPVRECTQPPQIVILLKDKEASGEIASKLNGLLLALEQSGADRVMLSVPDMPDLTVNIVEDSPVSSEGRLVRPYAGPAEVAIVQGDVFKGGVGKEFLNLSIARVRIPNGDQFLALIDRRQYERQAMIRTISAVPFEISSLIRLDARPQLPSTISAFVKPTLNLRTVEPE